MGVSIVRTLRRVALGIVLAVAIAGTTDTFADNEAPDMILVNGAIYTMRPHRPMVEAVAIRGDRFIAIGKSSAIKRLASDKTLVIDLKGRMAMPGLITGHVHPLEAVTDKLYSCKFDFTATPEQIADVLKQCVHDHPDAKWIAGGAWDSDFFENHHIASPRKWLDKYSGDKAVYFEDDAGHNAWVNSRALALSGVTRATLSPKGGKLERNPKTGEPNGLLLEQARFLVKNHVPDWSAGEYRAAVLKTLQITAGYGITGIKDAYTSIAELKAYHDVDQHGTITLHVATCIATFNGYRDKPLDYARLERIRDKFASKNVDTRCVKIIDDGVPTAARTAAMMQPYTPHKGFPKGWRGKLLVGETTLTKDITELERRGFTVKIHATGDRSIHTALNAIENAHKATGRSDLRHELAHAGFILPSDIPRFRQLNVVADLSPYIWFPSPIIKSIIDAVGKERGEHYWPIKDLLASGAPVLAGSDWPAAVKSMNPWIGIEGMVTRRNPYGKTPGTLWPEQAISLQQALRIWTVGGARALRMENQTGTIKVGKLADIIVLDRNLFKIDPSAIGDTRVEMTIFGGKIVHEQ